MAKDPALLWYPGDYISGTMGMSFEEKGAYVELLMLQFSRGHMTSHMIGQTVGQIWDKISCKFIQDADGLWYNERLDVEKNKRKAFTNSRKNNLSGTNQYTKKRGHTTSRMENENENIKRGGVGGEKIAGIEFRENKKEVILSDGTIQKLGKSQLIRMSFDDIKPKDIFKGQIV
jgi:uncharacterized protein YdaU (DUF1376 family)